MQVLYFPLYLYFSYILLSGDFLLLDVSKACKISSNDAEDMVSHCSFLFIWITGKSELCHLGDFIVDLLFACSLSPSPLSLKPPSPLKLESTIDPLSFLFHR